MEILWLTWKDHAHPTAGGAEVVLLELSKRLTNDGHHVTWLTCGYDGASKRETYEGIDIIRFGKNRYLHSMQALLYYIKNLRNKFDVVIEEVNTAPYMSVFFGKKSKHILLYHMLCKEIWFFEAKPPLSYLGRYILEPVATWFLSTTKSPVITVSESTKQDLMRYGFKADNIHVITEGIQLNPVKSLKKI